MATITRALPAAVGTAKIKLMTSMAAKLLLSLLVRQFVLLEVSSKQKDNGWSIAKLRKDFLYRPKIELSFSVEVLY
jgi:hypothetical protein